MPSLEVASDVEARSNVGTLARLLDPAFGFFVWSAHFLIVYIAAAVLCILSLGTANPGARSTFLTALVLVTVAAALILVVHAIVRHRQRTDLSAQRFKVALTIGGDAIAVVAILLQVLPIFLVPVCA